MWEKELTAIEANKFISPHFPATNHGDGFWVDTCSQSAPHATCSTQVCRTGTPNECQAEGTGVQACFGQHTEQLDNNYFAAFSGDDSNPDFADWTETETAGDGTASVTAYRAMTKHGNVAVRLKTTGTTSSVELSSECLTAGVGSDIYGEASALAIDESTILEIGVVEYSDVACSGSLAITYLHLGSINGVWNTFGDSKSTWDGSANSYRLFARVRNQTGDVLIDALSVKEASYRTPFIPCPTGSGTCTATARDHRLHNPLSDFDETTQKYGYEDGFCASAWVYTDWVGDDGIAHYVFAVPGTAGNNNRWHILKDAADNLIWRIYDNAGDDRRVYLVLTGVTWTAGNWKYVEVCSNNSDNTIEGRFYNEANSTWYDLGSIAGVGTGIQAGQSTDLHVGHLANGSYLDGYQNRIHLSPYPTGNFVWPMKGWNSGKPPVNGRPY